MDRSTRYPHHLAAHLAARLRAERGHAPPESLLTRLLETLYFASLKTDEGRPTLCTVNFVDPNVLAHESAQHAPADRWSYIPFQRPLPFDVRTLTKMARAADPAVSSLAVFADRSHKLFIWAMVDQELRYSDYITLDALPNLERPGIFQATMTGVGNLSVYTNYSLVGSLEHNNLIQEYHDVLWSGPVHRIMQSHLKEYLTDERTRHGLDRASPDFAHLESELLVRWVNAISRILMHIQHYRHGGGLLIVPGKSLDGLNVKYKIRYDRLSKALLGMLEAHFSRSRLAAEIDENCRDRQQDTLACAMHYDLRASRRRFDEFKNGAQGSAHFVAALTCVDGFVVLDKRLNVQGFGVEVRSDNQLRDVYVAGDADATPKRLRKLEMSQLGTRHRAMMRYCYENPGALGFVVSQDGDIRAITRVADKLVLWENIDVELAFKAEHGFLAIPEHVPSVATCRTHVA